MKLQTTLTEAFERAKEEIRRDIRAGILPRALYSFAEMFLYVDPFAYGGVKEAPHDARDCVEFWARFADDLDNWIKSGMV